MTRLPSLSALRAFEAAARHGSMTRAASELCVTHGAISRQVRGLEAELGVALFQGPKSRISLTPAGVRLSEALSDAFARMAQGVASVAQQDQNGVIVSSLGTLAMRWLIPRLPRFNTRHPEIRLRLTTCEGTDDAAQDRHDVALRVGGPDWPKGLTAQPFFTEYAGPVLAPHLAATLRLQTPADLRQAPLMHTTTRPEAWTEWCAQHGLDGALSPDGQQFEHFYFMLEAALSGLGVAMGFWHLVADDVAAGRLIAPFGFKPTGRVYAALMAKNSSRASRAFCTWLEKEAAAFSRERSCPSGA